MTQALFYALIAAGVCAIGVYGLVRRRDNLLRVLALNVLGNGVFLLLVALAVLRPDAAGRPDPLPQALVLTGIVISVSATALALALIRRLRQVTAGDRSC